MRYIPTVINYMYIILFGIAGYISLFYCISKTGIFSTYIFNGSYDNF